MNEPSATTQPLRCEDIRAATIDDVAVYVAIANDAQRWLQRRGLTQFVPAAHAEYAPHIRSLVENGILYCVWYEGAAVGFFSVTERPSQWWLRDNTRALYLSGMVVSEQLRGRGIGRGIIRWCIGQASRQRPSAVRLDCHAANQRLCSFYESERFVLCGKVEQHPGYFGCLYQRTLALTEEFGDQAMM